MGTEAVSFVLTCEVIAIFLDSGSIPGLKDLLEKELAAHSSLLAWEIPWTEEPGGLQSLGSQKSGT